MNRSREPEILKMPEEIGMQTYLFQIVQVLLRKMEILQKRKEVTQSGEYHIAAAEGKLPEKVIKNGLPPAGAFQEIYLSHGQLIEVSVNASQGKMLHADLNYRLKVI